ncbi:NAD dependent epimerase/dehydratase family protein [Mycena rebaudengoi]|nr:NAD dependent epimerase/dehydratase family protein [Mycena rebaudengoi]
MSTTTPPQVLLTGATGFIGGTVLTRLLNSSSPALATISCLIRDPERATILSSAYGSRVHPVLYQDLEDLDATTAVAAQHDIIISTTLGYHLPSALALLRGLAQRKAQTGKDVWMIHTSGASNLGDQPVSGRYLETREFDDAEDDIYGYEKMREALHPYIQRSTELGVIDAGLELGVKTLVMMPPMIYGVGTGLFNRKSIQIPTYVRATLDYGRAVVIGDGKGALDHVHVEDLAELYGIVVTEVLERGGRDLPTGMEGIIFSGNGRHTWMEVAQGVADACHEAEKVADRQVESVSLAEGVKIMASYLDGADEHMVELGLCSNSRSVPSVARRLGWKPERGSEAWQGGFRDDVEAVLKTR